MHAVRAYCVPLCYSGPSTPPQLGPPPTSRWGSSCNRTQHSRRLCLGEVRALSLNFANITHSSMHPHNQEVAAVAPQCAHAIPLHTGALHTPATGTPTHVNRTQPGRLPRLKPHTNTTYRSSQPHKSGQKQQLWLGRKGASRQQTLPSGPLKWFHHLFPKYHLLSSALHSIYVICAAGWLGETYEKEQQPQGTADDPSGMRIISWDPRIFHYRRFLSEGKGRGSPGRGGVYPAQQRGNVGIVCCEAFTALV